MRRKSDEHLNYTREKQGEFFPELQEPSVKKPGHFCRQDIALRKKIAFSLLYENLVLFFIVFIMLLVIFFSLGVEKGKRVISQSDETMLISRVHKVIEKEAPVEEKKSKTIASEAGKGSKSEIVEKREIVKKEKFEPSVRPYTIQVIAFKNEKNAGKEIELLKNEGYEVFLIPSKEWLQVCVGRYVDREKSKKDLDVLKKRYPTCYIRKVE